LGLSVADADALLTDLAKRQPDRITLDVDDAGVVWYRALEGPVGADPRVRVDDSVAVAAPQARVDPPAEPPAEAEEVEADEHDRPVGLRR
jgi:hypothetical protein